MRTCWFVVIRSGGSWWVDCEGKAYGPFDDQEEAQRVAVKIAKTFGDPARRSLIYSPGPDGRPRLIWSGKEPKDERRK